MDLPIFVFLCRKLLCPSLLSLVEAQLNSFTRVIREAALFDHELMKIVSQKVCALTATMAVVDAKEGADGPRRVLSLERGVSHQILPALRLRYVQNDGDAVLIVVPDQSLMSIGCVSPDHSIPAHRCLARLVGQVLGQQDLAGRLEGVVGILGEWTACFVRQAILSDAIIGASKGRRSDVLPSTRLASTLDVILARLWRWRQPVMMTISNSGAHWLPRLLLRAFSGVTLGASVHVLMRCGRKGGHTALKHA